MSAFKLPPISDSKDTWGPNPADAKLPLESIPFAPYSKSDRLGRIADWNEPDGRTNQGANQGGTTGRSTRANQRMRDGQQVYGSGSTNTFAYFHLEDESSFS